jgi:hypothetical protein
MKKILIGLMLFGTMSAFAGTTNGCQISPMRSDEPLTSADVKILEEKNYNVGLSNEPSDLKVLIGEFCENNRNNLLQCSVIVKLINGSDNELVKTYGISLKSLIEEGTGGALKRAHRRAFNDLPACEK